MDFRTTSPNFGRLSGFQTQTTGGPRILITILIILTVLFLIGLIVWLVWYRPMGKSFFQFFIDILKTIVDIVIWPFKFILQLLGLWPSDNIPAPALPEPDLGLPDLPQIVPEKPHTTHTEIVKHEIQECPPCNCDVTCPDNKINTKALEMEIDYLKNMVKFVGAIAKRENAINSQYKELYPGFNVYSPHVRRLSAEYNYIKNEIRKDKDMWQYFKNYFTKLSGVPSNSTSMMYDVLL